MARRKSRLQPTWTDIKAKLADFDRARLLDLVRDLYAVRDDNRTFLHARFGLGEDVLEPYKRTIDRWLWPDAFRRENPSVSKAKQAISDYKKAVGEPDGLAELMVFYCEQATGFCSDLGYQDEGYLDALVRMFENALQLARALPAANQEKLLARLSRVSEMGHQLGYGVGDAMAFLFSKHVRR